MILISFLDMKEVNSAAPEPSVTAVPWMLGHTTSATTTSHTREMIICNTCITTCTELQSSSSEQSLSRGLPFLNSPEGRSLTLKYASEDEDRIVKEIVAMGGSSVKDRPPLTVAFLLCLCVQYSASCLHTSDLRRLLLRIASGVQSAMWVSCGEEKRHASLLGGPFHTPAFERVTCYLLSL